LHLRCPGIRVENVPELYATDSYADFLEGSYSKKRAQIYRRTLESLGLDSPSGERLLDLGCGTGIFMGVASELGYDPFGLDLSPASIRIAAERFGQDRVGFGAVWDAAQLGHDSYDVITLWSVLAHIADPREQLSAITKLLAPGGSLVILTVNANSLQRQVFQGRWNGFTPNHLVFWDTQTLTRLLTEVGFASVTFAPSYAVAIERGKTKLSSKQQERYMRVVDTADCGNMLRVVAKVGEAQS
jgi:SAM-dependent methyltransferase